MQIPDRGTQARRAAPSWGALCTLGTILDLRYSPASLVENSDFSGVQEMANNGSVLKMDPHGCWETLLPAAGQQRARRGKVKPQRSMCATSCAMVWSAADELIDRVDVAVQQLQSSLAVQCPVKALRHVWFAISFLLIHCKTGMRSAARITERGRMLTDTQVGNHSECFP
eukprot:6276565-Amphidinium_carterae.1